MTYSLLSESLHETADCAKTYFEKSYGAKHLKCECEVAPDLPLKPTWQAETHDGYTLCIEVRPSPMSPTIHEFVTKCATRCLPVKLWVAVPEDASGSEFNRELRTAKEIGVGVLQVPLNKNVQPHEHHRPVAFSLFAVRRTLPEAIPRKHRESIKKAQDAFIDGNPEEGCRLISEELEAITRRFAFAAFKKKRWWKAETKKGTGKGKPLKEKFFVTAPWASVLDLVDKRLIREKIRRKYPAFREDFLLGARQNTNWRNSVSHKPKTTKERDERDSKLRTMFEASRDLLLEWYTVARALKLKF